MILFGINDKGIIIPYVSGHTAYTYDNDESISADLIRSSKALYSYLRSEIDRLEKLINTLDRRMLVMEQAEDLRREPGWESWMPSDLSD